MPDPDLSETQPNGVSEDIQPNPVVRSGMKNLPRWLPLLILVGLIAIGLLGGYASGMGLRYSAENTVVTGQLADQFQLGKQACDAGQYEVCQKHYDYVMQKNPNYPGIQDAYKDLLYRMQTTPTLTFTPTPTITPTPDLRGADEQFKSAQDLMKAGDWDGVLSKLDSLRKIAPTYQTAVVDGMYYAALYQRGWAKIRPNDCQNTNLEAGINDLTMAEHFGPLDSVAVSLRIYARVYIAGSSFWDQDWKQAQEYFAQVMAAFPNMMDASCTTATERWRQATIKYAEQLANEGDACGAAEQYNSAFTVNSPDNEAYFPAATEASDQCSGNSGGGEEPPTTTPTGETLTPPVETPTFTPEPTLTTEPPTSTPTPKG